MMFSVYMRRCYKYAIALLAKKQRYPCPEKIHIRVTSPTSPKKMIFIPENMAFLLKYHTDFENFTGKDLCQSLFLNKVTGLTPATLLKKRLWYRCFPVNFGKFLKNTFFTEDLWAGASGVPIILCSFMETFIDVFIYCFPVKKSRELNI